MSVCKYCNKPIENESVWNPDKDGNGYHHSCLCELEFRSRDKQIYDKGRADVLEQIRAEIDCYLKNNEFGTEYRNDIKNILDKYAAQEPCDDAISRQAVLDLINADWKYEGLEEPVSSLPSVSPQEQTGHWIEKDGFDGDVYYDCSECGESWATIEGTPWDNEWHFCPNCGARMVEPQESEGKDADSN